MMTDNLIKALAEDRSSRPRSPGARILIALVIGLAIAAPMLMLTLGMRPDIGSALQTWRFTAKLTIAAVCLGFAAWASARLARPEIGLNEVLVGLSVAPLLLAAAVGTEMMMISPDDWMARAIGSNSRVCILAIPALAIAPLGVVLAALRGGAPSSPALAGAVGGLLAGAIGATLYATHCLDDSPLFVALWYTPAVLFITVLGAFAGQRLLRW
jgi:hypothetical protein